MTIKQPLRVQLWAGHVLIAETDDRDTWIRLLDELVTADRADDSDTSGPTTPEGGRGSA